VGGEDVLLAREHDDALGIPPSAHLGHGAQPLRRHQDVVGRRHEQWKAGDLARLDDAVDEIVLGGDRLEAPFGVEPRHRRLVSQGGEVLDGDVERRLGQGLGGDAQDPADHRLAPDGDESLVADAPSLGEGVQSGGAASGEDEDVRRGGHGAVPYRRAMSLGKLAGRAT
jgi:hypothetical protein